MFSYSISYVSKWGKFIRLVGLFVWLVVTLLGLFAMNGELVGAAGAVGICFLLPYVFIEQKSINERLDGLNRHFRNVRVMTDTMLDGDFEKLSDDEQEQLGEAQSDYASAQMHFESDVASLKHWEIAIGIFFTLQWAFSNLIVQFFVRSQTCCS